MARTYYDPTNGNTCLTEVVPIKFGGTGATSPEAASVTLGFVRLSTINQPNGVAGLDQNGQLPLSVFPQGIVSAANIIGPTTLFKGQVGEYFISDFDSFTEYTISATNGTVTRNNDYISYEPASEGEGGFIVNERVFAITVNPGGVVKPVIDALPSNSNQSPEFTSSAFQFIGADQTHVKSRWELATDSSFTNVVQFVEDAAHLTAWIPNNLLTNQAYYVRVRYEGSLTGWSAWSNAVTFTLNLDITGPTSLYISQAGEWTINNFDTDITYNLIANNGQVDRTNNIITFTAGTTAGNASFTVNGTVIPVTILPAGVVKPTITSPLNGDSNVGINPTFTCSTFATIGTTQNHTGNNWQIASDVTFTTIVDQYDGPLNLTSWKPNSLAADQTYYLRVRQQGSLTGWSNWSDTVTFTVNVTVEGPSSMYVGETATFTILEYDPTATYEVASTTGTATVSGSTITFVAGQTAGPGGFTLNGKNVSITILAGVVNKPTITIIDEGFTKITPNPTVKSSNFSIIGTTQTHKSSNWQIATDLEFKTIIVDVNTTSELIQWLCKNVLTQDIKHYVRVRYEGSVTGFSQWSDGFEFIPVIEIMTPAGTLFTGQTVTYKIMNYKSDVTYTITAISGVVSVNLSNISLTIPSGPTGITGIVVNGKRYESFTAASYVDAPTLSTTNPSKIKASLTSSAFKTVGATQTHNASRWEISSNNTFTQIVDSYEGSVNLTSWDSTFQLTPGTTYYARVKHSGNISGYGVWSSFITLNPDITITGPTTMYSGQAGIFQIQDYDATVTYTITTTNGVVSASGNKITYTPSSPGVGNINVNGKNFTVSVSSGFVNVPSITSPSSGATNISLTPVITSSAFSYVGPAQTQVGVRWEVSTTSTFSTLVNVYEGASNFTSWQISNLTNSTVYYVRVRYQGSTTGWTGWSPTVSFTTLANNNWVVRINDSADSGFYDMALNPNDGSIYVVGKMNENGYVARFNSNGSLVWQKYYYNAGIIHFETISVDTSGNLYVGGGNLISSSGFAVVLKLDSSGNYIWGTKVFSSGTCTDLECVDGSEIYFCGTSYQSSFGFIGRLISSGSLSWCKTLANSSFSSLDAGLFGGCYVVGSLKTGTNSSDNGIIIYFNSDGSVKWQNKITNSSGYAVVLQQLNYHEIYLDVVGSHYNGSYIEGIFMRFYHTGSLAWQIKFSGVREILGMSFNTAGEAFLVGYDFWDDGVILKVDINGNLIWQKSFGGRYGEWLYEIEYNFIQDSLYIVGQENSSTGTGDGIFMNFPSNGVTANTALSGSGLTALSFKNNGISSTSISNAVLASSFTFGNDSSATAINFVVNTASATRYFSTY